MQISHILSEYTSKSLKKDIQGKKPVEEGKKTLFSDKDSVEISSTLKPDRLAELKNRVKSGFYMTSAVTDDVSDKMTSMFDDMTE